MIKYDLTGSNSSQRVECALNHKKIRKNHKNTSKIQVFFLKYSYIRVSLYKYERLIHTVNLSLQAEEDELSDEDKQLKEELELCVTRLGSS